MKPTASSIGKRFWSSVRLEDNGCIVWTASKRRRGYGQISVNYKNYPAHRLSFQMFIGPIVNSLQVPHRCDNPSCVRPDHLFLGTYIHDSLA